jgi:hypothetical protein
LAEADGIFDRYEGVIEEDDVVFLDEGEACKGLNDEIYEI